MKKNIIKLKNTKTKKTKKYTPDKQDYTGKTTPPPKQARQHHTNTANPPTATIPDREPPKTPDLTEELALSCHWNDAMGYNAFS